METENNVEVQQNTKKKRIKLIAIIGGGCAIAIILFCSLFFTLFPFNEVKKDGFVFRKIESNGETGYTVSEYTEYETEIKIPSEIPKEVIYMGSAVFRYCSEDLIIYIEAKTPPKGWCLEETGWVDWNPDGCYEIWGYKGD